MNSICFLPNEFTDENIISFSDPKRINHLHIHLKSKINDILKITLIGRGIFEAKIKSLTQESAELEIVKIISKKNSWFHLAVGLSRPQTMKKVLEHTTTFGAASFTILKAQLSEKSYATSKLYQDLNYQDYLIDGLAQSKTYYKLPELNILNYLNLEELRKHKNKFFLSFNTEETFLSHSKKLDFPLIAIGPERGWTKSEEEKLIENDFIAIGISNTCLRVEHASFAAIAQIEMLKITLNEE